MSALDKYLSYGHQWECLAANIVETDKRFPCSCLHEQAAAELAQLRAELAEAKKIIDLTELTDGQMPSDARARLAFAAIGRKYPEEMK